MAEKSRKVEVVGEGKALGLKYSFENIGKQVVVPIGKWFDRLAVAGYTHGMKQRFSDLGALPKEMSDREKETTHLERITALAEHLDAGGDWKMDADRGPNLAEVVEAVHRLRPDISKKKLTKALEEAPDLIKEWRAKPKVKAMIAQVRAEKAAKAAEGDTETLDINL